MNAPHAGRKVWVGFGQNVNKVTKFKLKEKSRIDHLFKKK